MSARKGARLGRHQSVREVKIGDDLSARAAPGRLGRPPSAPGLPEKLDTVGVGRAQLLGQLISTRLAEELILLAVYALR